MRRFLASLAIFSLVETIGRQAIAAGVLTLLGVGGPAGGGGGGGSLTTPSLTPFVSSNFNPNQTVGLTSNSLSPNGGAQGAIEFPTTPTNSAAFYFEAVVNPALGYGFGSESPFANASVAINGAPGGNDQGQPVFYFNRQWNGSQPGSWWWLNPGSTPTTAGSATAGSGYATGGVYPFTAPSSGCIRSPAGVWAGGTFQQTDPGLGCPTGTMSLTATQIAANIPGSGAQQVTSGTICAVVIGEAVIVTNVAVAHGLTPGTTFSLAGYTPTGYNGTYTATFGTAGTTLVGTTGAASCPAAVTSEGTALSGTGAAINFPAVSTTTPYNFGSTGIATHNGQHICGWIVENGADSNFPGSQAIEMVDNQGNSLTGSPSLVPFLNQGTSDFVGSTSGSTLSVSSIVSHTITGATYNGTSGYVTFPVSANPAFVPGTEFTVSGIVTSPSSPNLYNQTYVAVTGTNTTQVVGEPLSGPAGIPQPFGSSPGAYSSGGSLVSVILPGQTVAGLSAYVLIMPYGTNGTTGTATSQAGQTFALSGAVTIVGSGPLFAYASFYYGETVAGVPTARTQGSIGDFFSELGGGWGGSIGNLATLWGVLPTQAGGAPSTADLGKICTKQTDIQTYAASKGIKVNSYYPLNDLGIFGDASNGTIRGYITNPGGTSATLNVVSTYLGSLALGTGTETANLTGVGLPVASPVTIPLTTSSSSTYAITPNTTAALGSIGAPVTFAVGAFKPAAPSASSTWKGWIDTTAGVSTLHVTSFDNGGTHAGFGSFTGSYAPSTGVLTASAPFVGSIPAPGIVQGTSITGQPILITQFTGGSGPYTYNVGSNYYPTITNDTTMWATTSSIVPGGYVFNPSIVNPIKIVGGSWSACGVAGAYNGLLGCYTLSEAPNAAGTVGASGAQVVFTGNTITDDGAIAPGPALTINHLDPGTVFPVNFGTNTGTLSLSGTYNTAALGGTPSGIQVLVSNSANGPPLVSCTNCNFGTLTGTISGGVWKGTLAGIPGGGPYFVSVRSTNGTAYATLSQSIRVGAAYAAWGNGQVQSMFGGQGGIVTSWFSGLQGTVKTDSAIDTYMTGPPIVGDFVPSQSINNAGDRFGVAPANVNIYPEPVLAFDQGVTNGFGVPASIFYAARDGVGMGVYALGNVKQTQTVGSGTGSQTTWCSAAKFCGNVDVGTPLTFNAASLTGTWFNGVVGTGITANVLTVTTRYGGALEPGMILGATGSPTVVRCLTSCTTPLNIDGSTWLLSSTSASGATGTLASPLRADPPSSLIPFGGTTTPWPNFDIQANGSVVMPFGGFGQPIIKTGSFNVAVNGTIVCQDSATFAYNITGGNCTGTGVSGFVNYLTGDYQIIFTTAPASNAAIIASWTNIISPEATSTGNTPQNLDEMGDGTPQSGFVSSRFSKFPSGVNGQIWSAQGTDSPNPMLNSGYPYGTPGYSQMISWLFGVKFPALIPGASASTPFLTTPTFRLERPGTMTVDLKDNLTSQWAQDVATSSTFPGTISTGVLLLSGPAVGPMWEGEIIGCSGCPPGMYIIGLAGGTWGSSGSSYALANASGVTISSATTMQNAVFYSGSGPAQYLGALNDTQSYDGTHPGAGFAGGRRATSRWAAEIYEATAGGNDPHADRVKGDAPGCDAAAAAAPCFNVGSGTTYNADFSTATWSPTGNTVTITGGLATHARPFVVGMNTYCSGCNSGLIITSISAPPTQNGGQVGATFTFNVQNVSGQPIGGTGSGLFAGGAAGTSGVGSNAIDIPISINVSGLSSPALDTCGSNTINGSASGHVVPTGKCQGGQIGDLVRGFRIGTAQQANGDGATGAAAGSVFDDGMDPATGTFNQSGAFTCNIVAADLIQCIKAPLYTAGVFAGVGQWPSGSTYISYGDEIIVASRVGTLLGYVGGQSFPFTGGTSYSPGTTQPIVTCSGGGTAPKIDVTVSSGGSIVNVVPSALSGAMGLNLVSTCSVALPAGGSGGAIPTITLGPVVGVGGIGTYNTDNDALGAAFLYDNSCGNGTGPLGKFFGNGMGGCFEPGLPVRPFGQFRGLAVSGDMSFLIFFLPVLRRRARPANDNRVHEKLAV